MSGLDLSDSISPPRRIIAATMVGGGFLRTGRATTEAAAIPRRQLVKRVFNNEKDSRERPTHHPAGAFTFTPAKRPRNVKAVRIGKVYFSSSIVLQNESSQGDRAERTRSGARVDSISAREFEIELSTIWPPRRFSKEACTIGLAISGGVDSMALASLCRTFVRSKNEGRQSYQCLYLLQAFIVDHGIREGSDIEAAKVSAILEEQGIPAQVLNLDWGSEKPAESSQLESLARRLRFQALGRACKEHGIDSLLLAHHEDDQAETVMMRLMRGHRQLGLEGIKSVAEIPECHGLHGIHESGGRLERKCHALLIEGGGIKIYRPLLGFPKARLVATCRSKGIVWVEDHTNQDPTLTPRNAIRHMFRSCELPPALRPTSLVAVSRRLQQKMANTGRGVDSLFRSCMMELDTRVGALKVSLPSSQALLDYDKQSRSCIRLIAALLLRNITTLVTPNEHVSLSSPTLHNAVNRIWPELTGNLPWPGTNQFVTNGVYFRPASSSKEDTSPNQWLLTRQPYHKSENTPYSKAPIHEIPPSARISGDRWTPWELFDGRFWFRVKKRSLIPVRIRPFRQEDAKAFGQDLSVIDRARFKKVENTLVAKDTKWRIPAVVWSDDGVERVLALPTLDLTSQRSTAQIECEVRFKKINMDLFLGPGRQTVEGRLVRPFLENRKII